MQAQVYDLIRPAQTIGGFAFNINGPAILIDIKLISIYKETPAVDAICPQNVGIHVN
jgi:hypothetical protein